MLTTKERRVFEREKMSDTILFRPISDETPRHFRSGKIKDISPGGIMFETEVKLAKGDVIDVFFKRKVSQTDTVARAEVVRTINMGARQEVGAKFVNAQSPA